MSEESVFQDVGIKESGESGDLGSLEAKLPEQRDLGRG